MTVCSLTRQNSEDLGERGGRKDLEGQETIIRTHFMRKIYFQLRKQCFFKKNYSFIVPGECAFSWTKLSTEKV